MARCADSVVGIDAVAQRWWFVTGKIFNQSFNADQDKGHAFN